uniref:Ppr10 n=1 Tax=Arundo donax TaxID=35708 RepID=A0A0A9DRQ4_ARUDO
MGRSWPRITTLLEEMRAAGVEPDDFTASTVIAACCQDGFVDEAVPFFEDLKADGHTPCVVTYNALLQVFGKAGNHTEALRVLKEMEQNGTTLTNIYFAPAQLRRRFTLF